MLCPKCGMENLDSARVCRSCGAQLPTAPVLPQGTPYGASGDIVPKTSRLAIAAFVLGTLSLFTCGLTAIPSVVLGIISLIVVEKSGGRLTGRTFAVLGIVIPVLIIFVLLHPMLLNIRQKAFRMMCGTNLSNIGHAMLVYVNEYEGKFPRSGGKQSPWAMRIPDWKAHNRSDAYGLAADGSGGQGSISSSFYLLVKYSYSPPLKAYVCKGDAGASEFNPAEEGEGGRELIDFWDFGSDPTKHCSYSYHHPFGDFPLTKSSDPGMAVAADRNPWIESPAGEAKQWPSSVFSFNVRKADARVLNAITHQENGQNVLFVDLHVAYQRHPFCGVNEDNIYTCWDGRDIRVGGTPWLGNRSMPASVPHGTLDSFLVHDGRGVVPGVHRHPQDRR